MENSMLQARKCSWEFIQELGLNTNPSLPLLDHMSQAREEKDICDRLLCLHSLAAVAYGLPRERAKAWLQEEGLMRLLGPHESRFLSGEDSDAWCFRLQIEGMWALAWVLGVAKDLAPCIACSESFVKMLPDLSKEESSGQFRSKLNVLPCEQIVQCADLYYCLHWALCQRQLNGMPPLQQPQLSVVKERRRALDWVLSSEHWWEISLDT